MRRLCSTIGPSRESLSKAAPPLERQVMEFLQLRPRLPASFFGKRVGAAPAITSMCPYEPVALQAADGSVQRPGSEPSMGELLDVLADGVAVLGTIVEAEGVKQPWL